MSQNSFNHSSPATVETNNFRQVLTHFDEEGHIISPDTTRFAVTCQICCKDLALVNDRFDVHSRDSHEAYTVIPRCGHAFGYKCLYDWLIKDSNVLNPQCPSRRADVYCELNHPAMFDMFGTCRSGEQHKDVLGIRAMLREAACEGCASGADRARPVVYIYHELQYARLLISHDVRVERELLDEQLELYHEKVEQLSASKHLLRELELLDEEESLLGDAGEPRDEELVRRWRDLTARRREFVSQLGGLLDSQRENYNRRTSNLFSQIGGLLNAVDLGDVV